MSIDDALCDLDQERRQREIARGNVVRVRQVCSSRDAGAQLVHDDLRGLSAEDSNPFLQADRVRVDWHVREHPSGVHSRKLLNILGNGTEDAKLP